MRILLIEDYAPLRKSVTQGFREAGFAVNLGSGFLGRWAIPGGRFSMHRDHAERGNENRARHGSMNNPT